MKNKKYIIEIAERHTHYTDDGKPYNLYRVKGFNSLVLDDYAIQKLEKYETKVKKKQPSITENLKRPKPKDYLLLDNCEETFLIHSYANDLEKYCNELEDINKSILKGEMRILKALDKACEELEKRKGHCKWNELDGNCPFSNCNEKCKYAVMTKVQWKEWLLEEVSK